MARALTRRELTYVGGLALAAVVWMYSSWQIDDEPAAAAKKAESVRKATTFGTVPVVHMDQLDRTVVKYDAKGRDLFKYSPRPPSWGEVKRLRAEAAAAAKRQKELEEQQRLIAEAKAKEDAARAEYDRLHPKPPPPPQPPPILFQFVGFIGPPDARVAAFQQNNDTIVARVGEVILRDFRVEDVRYESALISYVNPQFKGQTRELPLSRGLTR
jgi:hypothetical protein